MRTATLFGALFFSLSSYFFGQKPSGGSSVPSSTSPLCIAPESQVDLDISNVRTRILNAGDMWWDMSNPKYEIPKGSGDHSIFAGTLWMGGVDAGGQLHVAAMTYRQSGIDFWPGPLDTLSGTTYDSICNDYDYIWKVNKWEVEEYRLRFSEQGYQIPADIVTWPGNGISARGEAKYLAPFIDVNGDGNYKVVDGDYPGFNYSSTNNCQGQLQGDECLWWIINDNGNVHGETNGGLPLGIEIHCMAFAYSTTIEEINNATFYQYKSINRSTETYSDFWWGQYVDVDLGDYTDDRVGCDVKRGLGYAYNGDSQDGNGGPGSYGNFPPAIGVDFLGGPIADLGDGIDNDQDSLIDEFDERIKMSRFSMYVGAWGPMGDAGSDQDFYFYMQGKWLDGLPWTYGGDGYMEPGPICHYMFPGTSDPYGWGTGGIPMPLWDEISAGYPPSDRRYFQSLGPYTVQPGEVNYVTVGVPWAQDSAGNNLTSVNKLQLADDVLQDLFDTCFNFSCMPPTASIDYQVNGFNYLFAYYGNASSFNWNFGDNTGSSQKYPTHTYSSAGVYTVCLTVINSCGSSSTCTTLTIIDPTEPICGPNIVRLEGKGNSGFGIDITDETVTEILNSPDHRSLFPEYLGTRGPVQVIIKDFDQVIEGNYIIKFDSIAGTSRWKIYRVGVIDTVYADSINSTGHTQYIPQWGISVTVNHKPAPGLAGSVNNGFIEASMEFSDPSKKWLTGLTDGEHQDDRNWIRSGRRNDQTNSPCYASYDDYAGVDDLEIYETVMGGTWSPYRLAGATDASWTPPSPCYTGGPCWNKSFASLAPLRNLASVDLVITSDKSKWTRSCVLETSDDKYLVEPHPTNILLNARKLDLRTARSVDKNGNTGDSWVTNDPNDAEFISATGMGWFPGYAIDLETGERLNIAFGENSWLPGFNGRDMKWNPTSKDFLQPGSVPVFGGMHYIYIFGHNSDDTNFIPRYDYGKKIRILLNNNNAVNNPVDNVKRNVFRDAMWVNIPLLAPGHSLFETDVKIRLRVMKPFAAYPTSTTPLNRDYPMYSFSLSLKEYVDCIDYDGPTTLYPNPFSEEALLEFSNPDGKPAHVKLYDVKGRLVRVYNSIQNDRIIIRKESLTHGVYFYELFVSEKEPQSGKFIIY